jgi:propanediol dehydratase large subunit
MTNSGVPNRWRRFDVWDERPLRLDKFAIEDPSNGFCAMQSPNDPKPSLTIRNGRVAEMDGVPEAAFDMVDRFIANHHLDLSVADEAMAVDSVAFARDMVDINVPREKLVRLARGMTPAKLAEIISTLSTMELAFAQAKLRTRRQPGNQAHVTNAKDCPLQLAADSAIAVLLGFNEIETTLRVARNCWAAALACAVGAAVGKGDALFQCSIEEAEELRIGMAGFTSYAETVSVYGTEQAFVDGDDTPWSKTFLTAAYASRGMKMRSTSGAASELLMGFHDARSMLYLEARCLCMQRGMGVQGTQNGGIDGAPLANSVPGGGRELLGENVLAALLDLECASGNDASTTESEIRVGAKIMPILMSGSDLITSGFGAIHRYDNSFGASLFNAEELEDFLAIQRDYLLEGGLRSIEPGEAWATRERAVAAVAAVLEELGLATIEPRMAASVVAASGSNETETLSLGQVGVISDTIKARALTGADVVRALAKRGFMDEAHNMHAMLLRRVPGDYLQTASIIREGRVVSAINDPNRYSGPGTGYVMSAERRAEIARFRDAVDRAAVLEQEGSIQRDEQRRYTLIERGDAVPGNDPMEIVIGLSPAWNVSLFKTTADHPLSAVLKALIDGIEAGGGGARIVRIRHTADTSFIGLSAARLAGSGYGIGIQSKGTAVLHQRDRLPHMNLELFSMAPMVALEHYRALGWNAARHASGEQPEPIRIPYAGESLGGRFYVRTALLYAIETAAADSTAAAIDLEARFT